MRSTKHVPRFCNKIRGSGGPWDLTQPTIGSPKSLGDLLHDLINKMCFTRQDTPNF